MIISKQYVITIFHCRGQHVYFVKPVRLPHCASYAETLSGNCHNINNWYSTPTLRHMEFYQRCSSALWTSLMSVLLNNTHIHTCTQTNTQSLDMGPGGEEGCDTEIPVHWYLPLITMCEGHLSPALARLSINHCGIGMIGIHEGSYCLPVFPTPPSSSCRL